MSDPQIPARARARRGRRGVHARFQAAPHASAVPHELYRHIRHAARLPALVPADFQTIYNLNPLYRQGINGTGQTITVVEDTNTYGTDVTTYRNAFLSSRTGTVTATHPEWRQRLHQSRH